MTQLTVEESGVRRSFRLGHGTYDVGSGEAAVLKLGGPGVAEVHAELEIGGQGVVLRPKPGVIPPLVDGVPVRAATAVKPGQTIAIGESKLRLEAESSAPAPTRPAPSPPARPAPPARPPASARPAAPKRPAAPSRGARAEGAARGDSKRGLWTALIAVAIVAVGAFVIKSLLAKAPSSSMGPGPMLAEAERNLAEGDTHKARQRVDALIARTDLTPAQQQQLATLKSRLEATQQGTQEQLDLMGADNFLENQLKDFLKNHVGETAARPQVRVFLMRCEEFKQRWPKHPEMDWVDRQMRRFQGMVNLNSPPTWADVEFEVKALTWASPRMYATAFAVLEKFAASADATDKLKVEQLVASKQQERAEWFADRMQQARYEFEKNNLPKSVGILFGIIVYCGDAGMANEAASQFLKFEDPSSWLRGYRKEKPDSYEALAKHPLIAEHLKKNPL
jgi:hypothetical protein